MDSPDAQFGHASGPPVLRTRFGPTRWGLRLLRMTPAAAGLVLVLMAVQPLDPTMSGWLWFALLVAGGFLLWTAFAPLTVGYFEIHAHGIEYYNQATRALAMIEREQIGQVTTKPDSTSGTDLQVVDRVGDQVMVYACPVRQWPDVKRACRSLGYPWKDSRPFARKFPGEADG